MSVYEGVRVCSTAHACDQAMRRVATLRGASRHGATRWIERSVAKALRDGRRSKTMPRWCAAGKHDHILYQRKKLAKHPGTYRFVWNETQSAVFVLVWAHEKEQAEGAGWAVMTVLVPRRTEPSSADRSGSYPDTP